MPMNVQISADNQRLLIKVAAPWVQKPVQMTPRRLHENRR